MSIHEVAVQIKLQSWNQLPMLALEVTMIGSDIANLTQIQFVSFTNLMRGVVY